MLREKRAVGKCNLGNILAFASLQRKTKKNFDVVTGRGTFRMHTDWLLARSPENRT